MNADASFDENDMNEFRGLVNEYVTLPEEIKKAEEPVKQSKARVKECEKNILEFMKANDIAQCKLPEEQGGGVLVQKTSTKKTPIKKENWIQGTEAFFKKRGIDATFDDLEKEVEATRDYADANKKRKKSIMESVEITMDRDEGSAKTTNERETEVFENPSGGSSVVILEDVSHPPEDERPIPPPKFSAPPLPRLNHQGNRRQVQTKEMLPAEDLLNFADLDSLANPTKLIPPKKDVQLPPPTKKPKSSRKPSAQEEEERPAAPLFPKAPPSKKAAQQKQRAPVAVKDRLRPERREEQERREERETEEPVKQRRESERQRREEPVRQRRESERQRREEEPERERREPEYEVRSGRKEVYEIRPRESRSRDRGGQEGGERRGREAGPSRYYENPYDEGPVDYYYDTTRQAYRESPSPEPRRQRRPRNDDNDNEERESRSRRQREPPVAPEELQRRRMEEEKKEKIELLQRLFRYEQRGHRMVNSYSMESSIDELQFEVSKIEHENSAKVSVRWYKVFLMIMVTTVEQLNNKFDPFGLKLKGVSKDFNAKKEEITPCLLRLHDKYSAKGTIEPEYELAMFFFGGMISYHFENSADSYGELGTLFKAVTGGGSSPPKPASAATADSQQVITNMPMLQQQSQLIQDLQRQISQQQAQIQAFHQQQQQQFSPSLPPQKQQQQFSPPPQQQQQPFSPSVQQQSRQPQQNSATLFNNEPIKYGPSGRRILRSPGFPNTGASIGLDVMNLMKEGENIDIPIDSSLELPPVIGGHNIGGAKVQTPVQPSPPPPTSRASGPKKLSKVTKPKNRATAPTATKGRQISLA